MRKQIKWDELPDLLEYKEVAEIFNKKVDTIKNWAKSGKFPEELFKRITDKAVYIKKEPLKRFVLS